jgi:hypothetical protein
MFSPNSLLNPLNIFELRWMCCNHRRLSFSYYSIGSYYSKGSFYFLMNLKDTYIHVTFLIFPVFFFSSQMHIYASSLSFVFILYRIYKFFLSSRSLCYIPLQKKIMWSLIWWCGTSGSARTLAQGVQNIKHY